MVSDNQFFGKVKPQDLRPGKYQLQPTWTQHNRQINWNQCKCLNQDREMRQRASETLNPQGVLVFRHSIGNRICQQRLRSTPLPLCSSTSLLLHHCVVKHVKAIANNFGLLLIYQCKLNQSYFFAHCCARLIYGFHFAVCCTSGEGVSCSVRGE